VPAALVSRTELFDPVKRADTIALKAFAELHRSSTNDLMTHNPP
jgi:hypothetical protein